MQATEPLGLEPIDRASDLDEILAERVGVEAAIDELADKHVHRHR